MKKVINALALLFLFVLTACENDLELAGEYVETPVIYGLLNPASDTQFVKINKTFLEEGENAIDLAKDPSNIYYDTLVATLTNQSTNSIDTLQRILKPKSPGIFNSDSNFVYYTANPISSRINYQLKVDLPDGKSANAQAKTIPAVTIRRPPEGKFISFVNSVGQLLPNYPLAVDYTEEMARFEVKMYFLYNEVINGQYFPKRVEIPVAAINNERQISENDATVPFDLDVFFDVLERNVPKTNTLKEISCVDNIMVEVAAADESFIFYQEVNGPIDGISQVRPEYSNINNGLGLFASRSTSRVRAKLSQNSVAYLMNSSPVAGRGWSYEGNSPTGCP